MQFREHTLENGLEVIAECNDQAHSAGIGFFVKTGSRDESPEVAGVSHFLEHMVFKGTPTRSAEAVNRELDEIGSHSNAYTSEEQTVYYATVLPEYQGRAVELLADIMRPSLRDDDFNMEKKVIIEEIRKYEDQPPFNAHEKCMAALFGKHPLSNSVLGTEESITAMTPQGMKAYFDRRYSPGNIVLCAAGKVDFDQLVAAARQYCGHWPKVDSSRTISPAKSHQQFQLIHKPSATQQYIVQMSQAPACDDPLRHAARLLATIVGDDSGSRLFWEIVDPGMAEYCAMGCSEYLGAGIIVTVLCCSPEDTSENVARVKEIVGKAQREGVTQDELEQARAKLCSHIVLRSERASSRLFAVGNSWIQRRQYRTVRDVVKSYQQVTVKEISAVLEKYPLTDKATIAVGPLESLNGVD